jgi:hypothetical protein
VPGTRLAELLRRRRHKINSVHHQGIKDLAPGFVVEARCPDDGMIEAIRRTGRRLGPACSGTPNSTPCRAGHAGRHAHAARLPGRRARGTNRTADTMTNLPSTTPPPAT